MKLLSFLLFNALLLPSIVLAQAPGKFNYQAVVRNAVGELVANQNISILVKIQSGSLPATVYYSEEHTPTTDGLGHIDISIGSEGNANDFAAIDWSDGPYFLHIEMDIAGGQNYMAVSTQQLLSVPYALYAEVAGNGVGTVGSTGPQGIAGPTGVTGASGSDGTDGATGISGPTGPIGPTGGAGGTLDQAYDFGGPPGNGRVITTDSGPVVFDGATGISATGKASIGTGLFDPDATLTVDGPTRLGADAPAIEQKYFSGNIVSGSVETDVPHGLNVDNIIAVNILVNGNPPTATPFWLPSSYDTVFVSSYQYTFEVTPSLLTIRHPDGTFVVGNEYRILITYCNGCN